MTPGTTTSKWRSSTGHVATSGTVNPGLTASRAHHRRPSFYTGTGHWRRRLPGVRLDNVAPFVDVSAISPRRSDGLGLTKRISTRERVRRRAGDILVRTPFLKRAAGHQRELFEYQLDNPGA